MGRRQDDGDAEYLRILLGESRDCMSCVATECWCEIVESQGSSAVNARFCDFTITYSILFTSFIFYFKIKIDSISSKIKQHKIESPVCFGAIKLKSGCKIVRRFIYRGTSIFASSMNSIALNGSPDALSKICTSMLLTFIIYNYIICCRSLELFTFRHSKKWLQ